MANKDFRAGSRFKATGYTPVDGGNAFIDVKIGTWEEVEVSFKLYPAEARALAHAIHSAADFAEPRVTSAADLGLEEAA